MRIKSGLSLLEIIICAAIFVVLVLALVGILNAVDKIWHQDMAAVYLQQTVRYVMDGMLREIRQSRSQDVVLDPLSNGAKITFKVPGNNNTISYYLQTIDGVVYTVREHPAGTNRFLTNNINSLCFCWDSVSNSCLVNCSEVFTLRINASKTVKQRALQFNLLEKVRLRNE